MVMACCAKRMKLSSHAIPYVWYTWGTVCRCSWYWKETAKVTGCPPLSLSSGSGPVRAGMGGRRPP